MRAYEKTDRIEWAVAKMQELSRKGDTEGIWRVYRWAEDCARGSIERRKKLDSALSAALHPDEDGT